MGDIGGAIVSRTLWISLDVSGLGDDRTSSLGINSAEPSLLRVTGTLRHNETIAPRSQRDADALRAWLDTYYPVYPVRS